MYKKKGFSLIDLMSVVAITGIVFTPAYESTYQHFYSQENILYSYNEIIQTCEK